LLLTRVTDVVLIACDVLLLILWVVDVLDADTRVWENDDEDVENDEESSESDEEFIEFGNRFIEFIEFEDDMFVSLVVVFDEVTVVLDEAIVLDDSLDTNGFGAIVGFGPGLIFLDNILLDAFSFELGM
jgi:hypothetical protein